MSRLPSLNGAGSRSSGAPLRRSSRMLLESGGVLEAPVTASCSRPTALAPLASLPRAPPPADVCPKRPTTAARRTQRHLQPLAPLQAGRPAAPAGSSQMNRSVSLVPAPPSRPKPTKRRKEVSLTDVLKKYNLLPQSRPSSPLSPCVSPVRPSDLLRVAEPVVRPRNPVPRPCSPPPSSEELPEPREKKGPLLARRAARDAPEVVPVPPPRLLPALGQGRVSLVSSNACDQVPKKPKKGGRGRRVWWSHLVQPQCDELEMSLHPATYDPLLAVSEGVLDINTMRRTIYMCPMTCPKNYCGRGLRLNLDLPREEPFRMRLRSQVMCFRHRIMLK